MRIIAIDPGYDRLGVAVLERVSGVDQLVFSTCILTNKDDELPLRIASAGKALATILKTYHPSMLAIETLFFSKNIKTGIAVAEMRGVCLYLAIEHGCSVSEYSPQQIKVAVTGYGNSDKSAVTMMVKRLVRDVPETAVDDEYDAIATAITCLAHQRF